MFVSVARRVRPVANVRFAAAFVLAALVGCACGEIETGPPEATDDSEIDIFISSIGDQLGTPEGFQDLFAEGAAAADSKRDEYRQYNFTMMSVDISGNSATATVSVEDANEKSIGEVEWTLEKQDGWWLLKKAPLP